MTDHYSLINQPEQLEPLLEDVARHATVAIDTEADSMHHYREKLCLIQLGIGERQWIVDPLASGLDLTPLIRLLEARELIFHGADYDLRLLFRTFEFKPARVFDTMLAAQLLGRPRIGLAALVEEVCGVVLSKQGQKADWSRRPLPQDLLHYAADDTRYLYRVAKALREELSACGRLIWHGETCERLIQTAREVRTANPVDAWRIKGGRNLNGRPGAVLRELWHWREEAASRSDRPPYKIATGEFLLQWVEWAAANPGATLERAPARPAWLRGGRLRAFERALERGLNTPEHLWPKPPVVAKVPRLSRDAEDLLQHIIEARDREAGRLGLDPGILGARDALRGLLRQRPRTTEDLRATSPLMNWQTEVLLPAILPLLQNDGYGDD